MVRLCCIAAAWLLVVLSAEICWGETVAKPPVHLVRRGDTLGRIAARYGVSVVQLRQWNGLSGDRIQAGQRLQVGRRGPSGQYLVRPGDTLSEIAARAGLSVALLRRLNGLTGNRIYAGQRLRLRAGETGAKVTTHRVRRGDTLSKIAKLHRISLSDLKEINDLTSDKIRPGQILRVTEPPPSEPEEVREYTVQKGDNLTHIARRFEVSLALLRQLNQIDGDQLQVGQKLVLRPSSLDEAVHIVRTGETLTSIGRKYGLEVATLQRINDIAGSRILVGQKLRLKSAGAAVHIVERGDALWEIARAYGVSLADLKALNELTGDRIYPGQELQLDRGAPPQYDIYMVEQGDYLDEIARLHQMSVAELKRINGLRGALIHPGDRLQVRPLLGGAVGKNGMERLLEVVDWQQLRVSPGGVRVIESENGPYYYAAPRAVQQRGSSYFEDHPSSSLQTYRRARALWEVFERQVEQMGQLSRELEGWHLVLDPGHGGLDPGAIVESLDGNGQRLYVVEDEYVYDIALRVYVLLRLHGAQVTMTLLSPNHLIRQSLPTERTFVHEKNEVFNSYSINRNNSLSNWPRGSRNGLAARVNIARQAFAKVPSKRRIFLSFHADNDANAPEVPMVLYYESRSGKRKDLVSRDFAKRLLPALGAGARVRGQGLAVLRNNPAAVKVLVEMRNLAYTDHAWALRYEQLRQRDAEKVVKGVRDYVGFQQRRAQR
ncbi:MAG: LysM peptidoglycan-binding domain-containing protein [Candidatus Latescibacteria bacterium]|nr:LysM peptidoglycan-binding domain-containing protein [Candidatus Latescibacterota bacterium]